MCQQGLPADLEYFYAHKGCRLGLDPACRKCRNAQRTAWKRRNRDRLSALRRASYASEYKARHDELEAARAARYPYRVQAERLVSGILDRRKKHGLSRAPELGRKQFFIDWLHRQPRCECCGVAFAIGPKRGVIRQDSPSIDRFDPLRGYDLDNIALICWRCNNIKRNYASDDLRRVADWMDAWGNQVDKFAEVA